MLLSTLLGAKRGHETVRPSGEVTCSPWLVRNRCRVRSQRNGNEETIYGEQIIGLLKEAEAGAKVAELCRKHGISEATYYNWKAKFGGMTVSDAQQLKELEQENNKLKKLLAESMLDKAALQDLLSRK